MGKKQRFNSFEDLGMAFGLKQTTPNKMENTKKSSSTNIRKNNYNTGNKSKNRPTTPYNFVTLNDEVVYPPLYEYVKDLTENKDIQNGYQEFLLDGKKYSGYIEVDIENITPLYIGGENKKFFSDGVNLCIPGSSLRGCLKNIFKIITNSAFRIDKENPDITDKILYFRNLAGKTVDPTKDLYADNFTQDIIYTDKNGDRKSKKASIAKAGFLVRENKEYFICRADLKVKKGSDWKVSPKGAPSITWYNDKAEVFTGKMKGKKHYYEIAHPVWKDKYIIPEEVLKGYRDDKNRKSLNLLQVKNAIRGTAKYAFLKGAENFDYIVPCFYVEENGVVSHFGAGPYYRIPYKNSIGDHIPNKIKDVQVDFTDALFGNKECWSSRIFVEDCYLQNDKSALEKEACSKILMGPNPTSFQFYLNTDKEGKAQHWENDTSIRGYKFYWHKKMDWHGEKNENKNMNNIIAPVKPNNYFKSKIRFENLDEIELGALMCLFSLAEEKDICYKLGMGKSIGLGTVKLIGKFYFRDNAYYQKLFADNKQGFAKAVTAINKKEFIDKFNQYLKKQMSSEAVEAYKKRIEELKAILSTKYMLSDKTEKWNKITRYMELGNKDDRNLVTSRVPLPTIKEVVKGLK